MKMKEGGYTWKDLDKSYWEGFDNAKNKMEKRIAELETENVDQKDQLTKAKEIIKNCIHILKHSGTALDWKTVINQAEQFLKEIE